MTGLGRLLATQEGKTNDGEEHRNSQNQSTIHLSSSKLLLRMTQRRRVLYVVANATATHSPRPMFSALAPVSAGAPAGTGI